MRDNSKHDEERGMRLARLRTEKGLSRNQIAKKLDVSEGTVKNYENGDCEIKASVLSELAQIYGTTMDELWFGHNRIEKETREEILVNKLERIRCILDE